MSVLNNPIAPPSEAYSIIERIVGERWFINNPPPSPPMERRPAVSAGIRVQITQWDFRPAEWEEIKVGLVTKPVSVRRVSQWKAGEAL